MTPPAGASRSREMRDPFQLQVSALAGKAYAPWLRHNLRRARGWIDAPLRELSVALVSDARMSEIHRRFMANAAPTDVLTFPIDLDARGRPVAGEVIVCVPEARRRARALGTVLRNELLLYALHGMLHLCGFDDRTARAFTRMHQMEDTILSRLGVGPVFRPSRARARRKSRRRPAKPAARRR